MEYPQLTLEDAIAEAQRDLWQLRLMQQAGPVGNTLAYVCPARSYIKDIQEACSPMLRAEAQALSEIPADIKAQLDRSTRRFGPGEVEEAAQLAPEVRRYVAVCRVREIVEWLVEDLASEGKPQLAPDLTLRKKRER